jgi:aspartate 1-decarboxylase
LIILSYCSVPDGEARRLTPKIVKVDAKNRILPWSPSASGRGSG